jgi:thiol-disulfide isomerase/thioredoxin
MTKSMMKTLIPIHRWSIGLFLLWACSTQKEPVPVANINISLDERVSNKEVKLFDPLDQLGYDEIDPLADWEAESPINAVLPLEREGIYQLNVDNNPFKVFLSGQTELSIKATKMGNQAELTFEGKGARENELLQQFSQAQMSNMQSLMSMELEDFERNNDSIYNAHTALLSADLDPEFTRLSEMMLKANWAMNATNYPMYYRSINGEALEGEVYEGKNIKAELEAYGNAILETAQTRSIFASILGIESMTRINNMGEERPTELNMFKKLSYSYLDELPSAELRAYFKANDLSEWIDFYGYEGAKEAFEDYKTEFSASPYISALEKKFAKWEIIAPGQPAPDFHYVSVNGDSLSLADFKGKVVYLDVWATWCGPCLAEFPASKELKKEYEGEENLVFMYVSIDEETDHQKWLDFLAKDPDFKGVHLFAHGAWRSKIAEDYMIKGIPRYMLIDHEGKVANSNAPRPSSGKMIRESLDELLKNALD